MTVTLFSRKPMSAYALSSEAVASYLGVDVDAQYVVKNGPDGLFEQKFAPNNRFTPAIYDSSKDLVLNQSVAVNRYLISLAKSDKGLLGKDSADKYETLMWANRVNSDVFPKFGPILGAMFGGKTLPAEKVAGIVSSADNAFAIFEARLQSHTYLVGEQLTLADVECAGLLFVAFTFLVNEAWMKKFPAIVRWAKTVLNGPAYAKRLEGSFAFATSDSLEKFWGLRNEFAKANGADAKAGAKAGEAKPKAESKPKPQAADEAETPKKATHPLADLGKSSTPIDELKRQYSNLETREEALPWFWNTFYNDEEWSLWKIDYKYNDELKMTFMSNNLIGGLFARLSASTKFLFGTAVVYGENNNNGIRGAFLVRGKDYFPAFEVAPDWESYAFTKLDASNPADRAELDDLWAWDKPLMVNGEPREIADGKVFK